jgi:hypothetical protein
MPADRHSRRTHSDMKKGAHDDVADGLGLSKLSSYRPTTSTKDTVTVEWEVLDVDSGTEEGRHLQAVQGTAIRKVLEWLAQNPAPAARTAA